MRTSELERCIRKELERLRAQIKDDNDSDIVVWAMRDTLACSQRPLRYHPRFGGRRPLPPEAKSLVIKWVERTKQEGIRSIICLLVEQQLDYYRGGLGLHEDGLLGYYQSEGFEVLHFPMTDYQPPRQSEKQRVLEAFRALPKPVLIHCSAAIDRTSPVAAYIVAHQRNVDGASA